LKSNTVLGSSGQPSPPTASWRIDRTRFLPLSVEQPRCGTQPPTFGPNERLNCPNNRTTFGPGTATSPTSRAIAAHRSDILGVVDEIGAGLGAGRAVEGCALEAAPRKPAVTADARPRVIHGLVGYL